LSTTRIAIAKGSQYAALDKWREFRRFLFVFSAALLVVWLVYFVAVLASSDLVIRLLLGAKYANTHDALILWGLFFGVYTIRRQLCTALGVYRQFKETAQHDILGSAVALAACLLLVFTIGRPGAIISLILGEAVTMLLYLRLYAKLRDRSTLAAAELALSRP
jgi:O-antigen/teichoic acid export membrane protein